MRLPSLLVLGLLLGSPFRALAGTCPTVEQYGIVFTFDNAVDCGQFANGDYWVSEPSPGAGVTLTGLSPAFTGLEHGWEVNPADPELQGFDARITGFDAARVPNLPYTALPGSSIVKAISVPEDPDCRPCLDTAAVLTVLSQPPPGGGTTLMRPPYPGVDKPLYDTATFRMELLPELAATPSAPALTDVADSMRRPWLDHKSGWTGRELHPVQNMPDYGAAIALVAGDALLALLLDAPSAEKLEVATHTVQVGLDLYYAYLNGSRWTPNGGHSSGRKGLIALAGTLLDNDEMVSVLAAARTTDFGEDGSLVIGSQSGSALWGQPCSELGYWNIFRFGNGSKTCVDPYGYIDGGEEPGSSYQFCCNSAPWRAHALPMQWIPQLRCAWRGDVFLEYVDRWVASGAHSQPDPCAPYDGNPDNYGLTYGPDGAGGCIADADAADGIGRFPELHGTNANGGFYSNAFQSEMWQVYRESAPGGIGDCPSLFEDGFESGDTSAWSTSVP